MSSRCFLIVNPTSGHYSEQGLNRVRERLQGAGFAADLLMTRRAEDAPLFAEQICRSHDRPLIVAGGGDGTINGVINGVIPGKATLAVLPLGTSNVLARELGIRSVDDAVDRIVAGRTKPLPVGLVEGEDIRRHFFLMVGIGLDGQVVEGVRLHEKRYFKEGAYLLSGVRSLLRWDRGRLGLKAGDLEKVCHSAVICNAAKYAGDFVLAREADLFAPGFATVCIEGGGRLGYIRIMLRLFAGMDAVGSGVSQFKSDAVTITGRKPVQVDGDFVGYSPVVIHSVSDFIRIVV